MKNPFENQSLTPRGPATDLLPVTPDDGALLPVVASAIYVEVGGVIVIETLREEQRTVSVPDFGFLPVATRRVLATGTTASGIHALVVA